MAGVGIYGYPKQTTAPTAPTAVPEPPSWLKPSSTQSTLTDGSGAGTFGFGTNPSVPPVPNAINPDQVLAKLQGLLPQPAPITAPTVTPATVALPLGASTYSQLAEAIYNSQATPVIRELGRQGDIAGEQLVGQLAQAGLADSGTGVGQRADLLRETQQRQEDVSRDVSAAATAQAINANLAVNQQNAQLEQQAKLANAGFNYESQVQNAANLLTRNQALSEGYLNAVGISGQQAAMWSQAYMQRLSEAERNRLLKDERLQQFHGEWLNYLINKEKIAEDRRQADQQLALQRAELKTQEELQRAQMLQQQGQFDQQLALQQQELSNPLNLMRQLGINPADTIGPAPVQRGGVIAHASYLNNLGRHIADTASPNQARSISNMSQDVYRSALGF